VKTPRPAAVVVLAVLAGTLLAAVLGLLTSGVQATVEPRGVPLAVAVPDGVPPLQQAAQRIAGQGGDQVSWRVTSPGEARRMLDDKEVYGVLELAPSAQGAEATVVVSGAVNPTGTQVAQQVLTGVAQAVSGQAVEVQTVHPASAAARAVPLAASALLWIGTLVGSVLVVAIALRAERPTTVPLRLATAVLVPVGATGALLGLMLLWDSSLRIDARLVGFLLLAAFAFAAVQGAVLRLLGLAGMAILAPLYLMAPAVAGQVPELLHPAYRALLWSWTPFRFSTEGVRSLLLLDGVPPDVRTALWVLGGMAVAGLIVLMWPSRRHPTMQDADEAAASMPVATHAA
jgi:hypothetical protein